MLSFGAGQIAVLLGLAVALNYNVGVAAPIIALILAAIIGLVNGVMARRVIKMNIAIMEMSMGKRNGSFPGYSRFQYSDRW